MAFDLKTIIAYWLFLSQAFFTHRSATNEYAINGRLFSYFIIASKKMKHTHFKVLLYLGNLLINKINL